MHRLTYYSRYKLQDINLIRHTLVDFYGCPMAIVALAFVFKSLDSTFKSSYGSKTLLWGTKLVSDSLSIVAVVLFGIISLAYTVKLLRYRKKCIKEWQHPVNGNFFSAITICMALFGILLYDYSLDFGIIVVWIGAIGQMLISVFRMSSLVYDYRSDDVITPALLMGPVGNFVSAMALASYSVDSDGHQRGLVSGVNYANIARFWFAVASLFGVTLFVITFKRSFHDAHAETRYRPLLWIWMAASSIAGPAYVAVNNQAVAVESDVFYQSLWLISVFFFAMNIVGFLRGFFSFVNDVSVWVMAFSACALAINTAQYYSTVQGTFAQVLLFFSVCFASYLCGICGVYTFVSIFDLTLFTPRNKWGPASFMKLTHEAFRYAIPQIRKLADSLAAENPHGARIFVNELEPFFRSFQEHSRHEDVVFFPLVRGLFPGLNPSVDQEHNSMEQRLDDMLRWMTVIKNAPPSLRPSQEVVEAVGILRTHLPAWCDEALEHMRNEENTITVVIRKYVSIERQREASRRSFNLTSSEDWHVIMPYLLKNLPVPLWKVRLIRTFIWVRLATYIYFSMHLIVSF